MVTNPGHRQIGKYFIETIETVEFDIAAGSSDESLVGMANALGLAGGARRVQHHAYIGGADFADGALEESWVAPVELATDFPQPVVRHQLRLGIVAQATRVVIVDVLEVGILRSDLEQLVDLFLILDDRVFDLGIVEHEQHFLRDRVLVHRYRHAAQALGRSERPVQSRPVVADDGQIHAVPESLRSQTASERAHLIGDLRPGPALPDAQGLFADRRAVPLLSRMLQQKQGEGVKPPTAEQVRLRQEFSSDGESGVDGTVRSRADLSELTMRMRYGCSAE